MAARLAGYKKLVLKLLESGADPDVKDTSCFILTQAKKGG